MVEILEATVTPQKKMRIMYKANLNYARFNRYFVDFLRKVFLAEADGSDGAYMLTERGRAFLAAMRKVQKLNVGEHA